MFVLPSLEVAAASRQEVVVGVPVDAQHCRTDWLLDVLANPPVNKKGKTIINEFIIKITILLAFDSPVVFFLKVADRDEPGTATNSKLVLYKIKGIYKAMKEASLNCCSGSPLGDHLTMVAARLIRRITRAGFHSLPWGVHTYALRSCQQV